MSILPLGWEQNVQIGSERPSQVQCSSEDRNSTAILNSTTTYAGPSSQGPAPAQLPPTRGFLNIVRHGGGPLAIYVVTYRRLDRLMVIPKPVLAEGARLLIELLERLGVNLQLSEVRGALEDVHRLGSANIPDLWWSDEQVAAKGLVED